ncbi:MAG TPA: hypothetical protein DCX74_01525 [Firmicutes bacterium]|jgi:hypothetical protein|nr:hypothetical protein [Bacillota bacterium]
MNNEMRNGWIDIISKMYKDLHNSERVLHVSKESDKKRERLLNYFNRLEKIHKRVSESKNKSDEKLLKGFYYDLYVIKPEDIPESYFQNQVKLARERGYGNIELTNEDKKRMTDQVIEDQKHSLDKWIEYFLYDEESKSYEMWEKYWVFQGLQNLGKYDKKTYKFSKRDKTTVYPFPPVEREFIFTTLHLMEDYIKDKKGDEEIKSALGSGNFKMLYEYVIKQSMLKDKLQSNTTSGKWVKYEQGSDYNILRDSLQGYYTGWCTAAGENFAKSQLAGGDFYVYYTLDNNGEAKVPRIAIRMNGKTEIEEIRGIADRQNMEPEMMPILEEKLKEFPDRDKYLKKEHDMKLLTLIDKKINNNIELTLNELKFLYEINSKIEGFGYEKDPRIDEIKSKRNIKKDYALIFDVKEEEVALSQEEWEENPNKFKVLVSDLYLWLLVKPNGLVLPHHINGSLFLSALTSAEGLVLPQNIGGDLYLTRLTSAEGLVLPQSIGDSLFLSALTSAESLVLPQSIGGDLDIHNLDSAESLVLPQNIGGNLYLSNLTSAKGLVLPQSIGGSLMLSGLTSANGLVLPQSVGDDLFLDNLTSAEGLVLPQSVGGYLDIHNLDSAESLVLPQNIGGGLDLSGLTSANGLVLPYGFNLNKLICPSYIKNEILQNPDKYFRKPPSEEENISVHHKR